MFELRRWGTRICSIALWCVVQEAATFAIAQADLTDYPGMGLSRPSDGKPGVAVRLAARMDDVSVAARLLPGRDLISPWRVVMVADDLGRLPESTLLENLNPASRLADTSWIRPGKYAWNWWSGGTFSNVAHPGMNNATIERFIEFAREMHLEYMIIHAGWTLSDHDGLLPWWPCLPTEDQMR